MSFLKNLLNKAVTSYKGDTVFLTGASSAIANIIAADGNIDESEKDKALEGMMANKTLSGSFTPSQLEDALNTGLQRAKSRAGRIENKRFIEALAMRPIELRQDILAIAADVADDGGIGEAEKAELIKLGQVLNITDVAKFLGL